MTQSGDDDRSGGAPPSATPLAKARYYVNEILMEAYHFVYGLFFASTKKDQEYEDERWRDRKRER